MQGVVGILRQNRPLGESCSQTYSTGSIKIGVALPSNVGETGLQGKLKPKQLRAEMVWISIVWAVRTAILAAIAWGVWRVATSQVDVMPGDEALPVYRQHIKVGNPYSHRYYEVRWKVWGVLGGVFLAVIVFVLALAAFDT